MSSTRSTLFNEGGVLRLSLMLQEVEAQWTAATDQGAAKDACVPPTLPIGLPECLPVRSADAQQTLLGEIAESPRTDVLPQTQSAGVDASSGRQHQVSIQPNGWIQRASDAVFEQATANLQENQATLTRFHENPESFQHFLGHLAGRELSTAAIEQELKALAFTEHEARDAATALQRLGRDTHALSHFMAGNHGATAIPFQRLHQAIPAAKQRVAIIQMELQQLDGHREQVLVSGRFSAIKEDVLSGDAFAEGRATIEHGIRQLRDERRAQNVGGVLMIDQAQDALPTEHVASRGARAGLVGHALVSDFRRLQRAGTYEALGLAASGFQDRTAVNATANRVVEGLSFVNPAAGLAAEILKAGVSSE